MWKFYCDKKGFINEINCIQSIFLIQMNIEYVRVNEKELYLVYSILQSFGFQSAKILTY